MLINFCESRLKPEIQCSTVSTDGYDVTNLISDPCKGFLAYSCIKPPVNIDITFICNVRLHHVIIWPSVGSQKSSGFQLYAKITNDSFVPYTLLSNGYLNSCDAGLLFYSADVDHERISTPPNFLKRYIKVSLRHLTAYVNTLRICICKTQNSVPALGKIEIWGTVSPKCGKDVVAAVHTLWLNRQASCSVKEQLSTSTSTVVKETNNANTVVTTLDVPEDFLDAITYEIMTQPIILPSGKIVDQTTLRKHEESEAVWGRSISDPFTGLPFSESCRPIIAAALKARLDKFLLKNSDTEEVKRLPRVLGHKLPPNALRNRTVLQLSEPIRVIDNVPKKDISIKSKAYSTENDSKKRKGHSCRLPVSVLDPYQITDISKSVKRRKVDTCLSIDTHKSKEYSGEQMDDKSNIENRTDDKDIEVLLSNLKRFSALEKEECAASLNSCTCCTDSIFYKLPCKHAVCRKILIQDTKHRCKSCDTPYKPSEVERIYC